MLITILIKYPYDFLKNLFFVNSLQQIWQAVLGNLELSLSKASFTTWFKNTSILEQNDEKMIIGVPNTFTKEWLVNKYHHDILKAFKMIDPAVKTVEYRIATAHNNPNPTEVKNEVKKIAASPNFETND